jgi:hypothetical protein
VLELEPRLHVRMRGVEDREEAAVEEFALRLVEADAGVDVDVEFRDSTVSMALRSPPTTSRRRCRGLPCACPRGDATGRTRLLGVRSKPVVGPGHGQGLPLLAWVLRRRGPPHRPEEGHGA